MQIKIFNSRKLNKTQEFNLYLATNNLKKECFIGRSPASTLVLDSADVSRLHGKFLQHSGDYYFIDIGSSNGSIINGKLAEINQKYLLKPGDIVRIGEFVLILEEIDVIRQDLAETVFGSTNATTITDRQDLQKQFPIDEIQRDESGNKFEAEATLIQLPTLNSTIEATALMAQPAAELEIFTSGDIFPEATEIPISDRPTHVEVFAPVAAAENLSNAREVDPFLELDPWQDLESEAKVEPASAPKPAVAAEKAIMTNKASTIVPGQYIALMAHGRQKPELAQFVAQHQEFFSQHLTIATPATSATLQQASIEVSAETPALPIGGYPAIANLVNSGNILAVILLEDVLQLPASERENQEALMRACNLNQVLLATNLATAEAIVRYIRSSHG